MLFGEVIKDAHCKHLKTKKNKTLKKEDAKIGEEEVDSESEEEEEEEPKVQKKMTSTDIPKIAATKIKKKINKQE
jgi:hypothetical protein